jgi:hypothetical protein
MPPKRKTHNVVGDTSVVYDTFQPQSMICGNGFSIPLSGTKDVYSSTGKADTIDFSQCTPLEDGSAFSCNVKPRYPKTAIIETACIKAAGLDLKYKYGNNPDLNIDVTSCKPRAGGEDYSCSVIDGPGYDRNPRTTTVPKKIVDELQNAVETRCNIEYAGADGVEGEFSEAIPDLAALEMSREEIAALEYGVPVDTVV